MTKEREFYYKPPSDKAFEELKTATLEIWSKYDEPYRSEKKSKVSGLENVKDNFMVMVSMFDPENQKLLAEKLTEPTKQAVRDRMEAGGASTAQIMRFN